MCQECKKKDDLIRRLRAELSWHHAPNFENPALQAYVELAREKNPKYHINPFGAMQFPELFDEIPGLVN